MIDGGEKRNRQLTFELQNSHVCEKGSKLEGRQLEPGEFSKCNKHEQMMKQFTGMQQKDWSLSFTADVLLYGFCSVTITFCEVIQIFLLFCRCKIQNFNYSFKRNGRFEE